MADFTSLLKKPAGLAKKPMELPVGDYTGMIKSFEFGDNNQNKTPYVRFGIVLTQWPDSVTDEEKLQDGKPIDLSKRTQRRDFYLTDESLWRLDEFLRSVNVEPNNRGYDEVIPEVVGAPVLVEVQQFMNKKTNEMGNQIGKVAGVQ